MDMFKGERPVPGAQGRLDQPGRYIERRKTGACGTGKAGYVLLLWLFYISLSKTADLWTWLDWTGADSVRVKQRIQVCRKPGADTCHGGDGLGVAWPSCCSLQRPAALRPLGPLQIPQTPIFLIIKPFYLFVYLFNNSKFEASDQPTLLEREQLEWPGSLATSIAGLLVGSWRFWHLLSSSPALPPEPGLWDCIVRSGCWETRCVSGPAFVAPRSPMVDIHDAPLGYLKIQKQMGNTWTRLKRLWSDFTWGSERNFSIEKKINPWGFLWLIHRREKNWRVGKFY